MLLTKKKEKIETEIVECKKKSWLIIQPNF